MVRMFQLSFILLLFTASFAQGASREFSVFDIRKTLPLTDAEPVQRDFYINMGTENGVKVGSYLAINRRIPVIDIYRNKVQDDLIVVVAYMKVIHAQKTMSVARMYAEADTAKIPVVQFEKVMLGDRVELASGEDIPVRDIASVKTETKPQPELKPESKIETKIEAKTEAKSESKPVVPVTAPQAVVKPEGKPEVKVGAAIDPGTVTTSRN